MVLLPRIWTPPSRGELLHLCMYLESWLVYIPLRKSIWAPCRADNREAARATYPMTSRVLCTKSDSTNINPSELLYAHLPAFAPQQFEKVESFRKFWVQLKCFGHMMYCARGVGIHQQHMRQQKMRRRLKQTFHSSRYSDSIAADQPAVDRYQKWQLLICTNSPWIP